MLLASRAGPVPVFDFRSGACFRSKCADHLHLPCFSACKWTYFQLKPTSKMHSVSSNGSWVQRTQTSVCLKKTPETNAQDGRCFDPTASPLAARHVSFRQLLRTWRRVGCSALLRDTLFPLFKDILNP